MLIKHNKKKQYFLYFKIISLSRDLLSVKLYLGVLLKCYHYFLNPRVSKKLKTFKNKKNKDLKHAIHLANIFLP